MARLLRDLLHAYDSLTERVAMAGREIEAGVQPFADRVRLLETIPGVDRASACAIMVEVGTDLSSFPKAKHLAAWAGLCPGNRESAGKRCHAPTRRGSKVLRSVLVECAHGAVRTHQCQFRGYHQAAHRAPRIPARHRGHRPQDASGDIRDPARRHAIPRPGD